MVNGWCMPPLLDTCTLMGEKALVEDGWISPDGVRVYGVCVWVDNRM